MAVGKTICDQNLGRPVSDSWHAHSGPGVTSVDSPAPPARRPCPQGLAQKYMKKAVKVDLIEKQAAQASTDVAHYMLLVGRPPQYVVGRGECLCGDYVMTSG